MALGAYIGLSPQAAAPHRRDAIQRQFAAIDGQVVPPDGEPRLLVSFEGFVRALNLLRNLIAPPTIGVDPVVTKVAITQAVMARGPDGGSTLSNRCTLTLESLAQVAKPGQIVMDLHLHSIIALESREYAQAFRRIDTGEQGRSIFAWDVARVRSQPTAPRAPTATQVLGGHWMPPEGPDRDRLVETARRIVAEAIGPLANVITHEAAARAERVHEMIRHIVERLPREQRESVTQRLVRALTI